MLITSWRCCAAHFMSEPAVGDGTCILSVLGWMGGGSYALSRVTASATSLPHVAWHSSAVV